MSARRGWVAGWGVLALIGGCTATPTPRAAPRATAVVVSEPLAIGDVPQPLGVLRVGHFSVRVLIARCGISDLIGTHADYYANPPLCHVQLRVVNDDGTFHTFPEARPLLVLRDRRTVPVAIDVMHIRRQPDTVELGARDALELHLWFQPRVRSAVAAVRVYGDADRDPAGSSLLPAAARVVDVPLVGLSS